MVPSRCPNLTYFNQNNPVIPCHQFPPMGRSYTAILLVVRGESRTAEFGVEPSKGVPRCAYRNFRDKRPSVTGKQVFQPGDRSREVVGGLSEWAREGDDGAEGGC